MWIDKNIRWINQLPLYKGSPQNWDFTNNDMFGKIIW